MTVAMPIEERFPRPAVMGVLNVTPDSFSDGGAFARPATRSPMVKRLREDGAGIVDVGGESTRPGADPVPADEELRRVTPVLEGLAGIPLSIDTSKAEVARRALELGAELVNDVTALRGDPEMAASSPRRRVRVPHAHAGAPRTMQAAPQYDDVVSDVVAFLEERVAFAVDHGIREERICLDPGIGFGKRPTTTWSFCADWTSDRARPSARGRRVAQEHAREDRRLRELGSGARAGVGGRGRQRLRPRSG